MDWNVIWDFVINQGVWCVLFVWLLFETQKKNEAREDKLTVIMSQQGEKLAEITNTLDRMNERLERIEENQDKELNS